MEKTTCADCGDSASADSMDDNVRHTPHRRENDKGELDTHQQEINYLDTMNSVVALLAAIPALAAFFAVDEIYGSKLAATFALFSAALVVMTVWAFTRVFVGVARDLNAIRQHLNK
jgi:hypothetical protein